MYLLFAKNAPTDVPTSEPSITYDDTQKSRWPLLWYIHKAGIPCGTTVPRIEVAIAVLRLTPQKRSSGIIKTPAPMPVIPIDKPVSNPIKVKASAFIYILK